MYNLYMNYCNKMLGILVAIRYINLAVLFCWELRYVKKS
jgi:hypothetical protein